MPQDFFSQNKIGRSFKSQNFVRANFNYADIWGSIQYLLKETGKINGVAEQWDELGQALEAALLYEREQRVAHRRSC
jgi:hypothetical protein